MYQIRLVKHEERDQLKKFIKKYWSSEHIFVQENRILDFQHLEDKHYNFVVAYHTSTNSFHGVLGFIAPSFYRGGKIVLDDHIWLALWKVEKSLTQSNSLGLDMLNYIEEQYKPKSISAIGITKEVALLYRMLGFTVVDMHHMYMLNDQIEKFDIAQISKHMSTNPHIKSDNYKITEVGFFEINENDLGPANGTGKNKEYFLSRYQRHPLYRYKCHEVKKGNQHIAYFIGRMLQVGKKTCYRITDFSFAKQPSDDLKDTFKSFLYDHGYEYIDCLYYGSQFDYLSICGFIFNSMDNYVPHYFEPFDSTKKITKIAFKSKSNIEFFKGDSDLDRPSIINKIQEWGYE